MEAQAQILDEIRAVRQTLDILVMALVSDAESDPSTGLVEALENVAKAVTAQAEQVTRLTSEVNDLRRRLDVASREPAFA